jgi:chaperonin cofactor prefoldin
VAQRASQAVDVDVDTSAEPEPVPDDAGTEELRRQLAAREERIEELETAITDLRVQRDGLTDERDRLESEVGRLEGEVADLESEVERLQSRLEDGVEDRQRLSRKDALEGTNLFIRYGSKSGGTLDKAHRGDVDRDEVNENLRLEHHTQFEAGEVVVEDEPFERFLEGTIYRGFVEWIVRDLLYEIQDTGHVKSLRELYDAIPQIDRAELLGDVSVRFTEDGEEYREQRSFDVVLRDRMGNPLVVANLNDSRNPADRGMMEAVIDNGTDVKESNESLASAMMVTSSFFKPGALEAADEAHAGSLLGRDSKESYVKLNRKAGFHLILVESRGGDFHVNVPEL